MKIGIAYDTSDMYFECNNKLYYDFADIVSINNLKKHMEQLGYEVELLGNIDTILAKINNKSFNCDLIYNTVEGICSRNREGLLPSLLEIHKIPYIGTDAFGLSLTLDKTISKILAKNIGILTPNYFTVYNHNDVKLVKNKISKLRLPLIIKPNYEGNSSGISVCEDYDIAECTILNLFDKYNTAILCEEFILGQEITVPIIGNNIDNFIYGITTVDIQKNERFWLDVDIKVFGDYKNILMKLPQSIEKKFARICFELFKKIGCKDFARFDFRLTSDNKIYFIEANPLPSLFEGGSFDILGRKYGYTYSQIIEKIIYAACQRLSIPKI